MTADEVLEAMARGYARARWPGRHWRELSPAEQEAMEDATRAAVRAAQEVGAILVAEMPDRMELGRTPEHYAVAAGHNAALDAVRAKAVVVEEK